MHRINEDFDSSCVDQLQVLVLSTFILNLVPLNQIALLFVSDDGVSGVIVVKVDRHERKEFVLGILIENEAVHIIILHVKDLDEDVVAYVSHKYACRATIFKQVDFSIHLVVLVQYFPGLCNFTHHSCL